MSNVTKISGARRSARNRSNGEISKKEKVVGGAFIM